MKKKKIDKPSFKLAKRHRESIQTKQETNGDRTRDIKEIQRIKRTYIKNLYFNKLKNLSVMIIFLLRYYLMQGNQSQLNNLNI